MLTIAFLLTQTAATADDLFPGIFGDELRQRIQTTILQRERCPTGLHANIMFARIDNVSGAVTCVYTPPL
jgi:hypothetical protein